MSKALTELTRDAAHWEPKIPFDLVITYEDRPARDRAMALYDRVAQQLIDDYDFKCSWWKFDLLRNQDLMAQAVDATIHANMVILSLSGGAQLPEAGKAWLESWVDYRTSTKSALVVLSGLSSQEACDRSHLQAYLQQIAKRAKMDFFFHANDPQAMRPHHTVESISERATTVTPVLQGILRHRSQFRDLRME
jgi:hypothetical protein